MSAATLFVILVVGLIAGWLAGQVVKGTGLGLVAFCCSSSDWLTGEGGGDRLAPYLATKVAELRARCALGSSIATNM